MSLRLAIAASLSDMAVGTNSQAKRKHNFSDDGLRAKRQRVSDTIRSKRKHSVEDEPREKKRQRMSGTVEEQATRASRLASRLTRIEEETDYARTHMSQQNFLRLYPLDQCLE